jgi:hypothetical protein
MKMHDLLAGGHFAVLNFLTRKDRRTPWLFLLTFALFVTTCKMMHIDPQGPLPATLISTASLFALLKI